LYETSGTRADSWIKLKNVNLNMGTQNDGDAVIRDSLDLIPIGGFYGKGSRTGIYGSYLMAAYNRQEKRFESVCKLGTGFSQEQLRQLHGQAVKMDEEDPEQAARMAKQIYKVSSTLTPDVWFKPVHVWEV
jgi:DNA ligase-1